MSSYDFSAYPDIVSLIKLSQFRTFHLLEPRFEGVGHEATYKIDASEFFSVLIDRLPQNGSIPEDVIKFFKSSDVDTGFLEFQYDGLAGRVVNKFRILGATKEQCAARAEGLVRLLQDAIAEPLRIACRDPLDKMTQERDELKTQLDRATRKLEDLKEQKRHDPTTFLDDDAVRALSLQRRELEVELVGLRARMDAIEKTIAKYDKFKGRITTLEDRKIEAEIDLAGLMARREAIDKMIGDDEPRRELERKIAQQANVVRRLTNEFSKQETKLLNGQIPSVAKLAESLFLPTDITIAPIEWVK